MKIRIVERPSTYWKYSWSVEVLRWFFWWVRVADFDSNVVDTKEEARKYARKYKNKIVEEI